MTKGRFGNKSPKDQNLKRSETHKRVSEKQMKESKWSRTSLIQANRTSNLKFEFYTSLETHRPKLSQTSESHGLSCTSCTTCSHGLRWRTIVRVFGESHCWYFLDPGILEVVEEKNKQGLIWTDNRDWGTETEIWSLYIFFLGIQTKHSFFNVENTTTTRNLVTSQKKESIDNTCWIFRPTEHLILTNKRYWRKYFFFF